MHRLPKTRAGALLVALLLAIAGSAQAPEPVRYELRFEPPNTHLLDVTVRAAGLDGRAAELAMPAWAPGSYGINDYAKMVQGFAAAAADGRPLNWRKTDKQTWRIELDGARAVTVRYQLYGNTLSNTWTQYNDRHVFLSGPATWMYLVGGKQRPVELAIHLPQAAAGWPAPADWRVATAMPRTGENTWTAPDYDWFIDSPIEIADWVEKTFTVAGTTYHVVVHDVLGRKDFTRFTADTQKIVEEITAMFGGPAPFREYWFLFHIWPGAGGGLEHLDSTQINFSSDWDSTAGAGRFGSDYELKLFVTAHEFYHAWNVKRLRPAGLGPFDYTREVHTPSLWIAEGVTSYYGQLALARAGLVAPEAYLQSIAELISGYERHPGRARRSLEETSWDTWFRARPPADSNLINTTYSYYDGGQVIGHLLDFTIRQATANRRSLDDWMRLLYQRHALPRPGFTPEEALRAASEVAGTDLGDFFRRYISGKEPLPYEACFGYAGIRVERETDPGGWLGAVVQRGEEGSALVWNVIPGSPAERAGLDRGDVILALDGQPIGESELLQGLTGRRPGETVRLAVRRWGESKTITVTLGANPYATFRLRPVENPTPLQQAIYRSWLGRAARGR